MTVYIMPYGDMPKSHRGAGYFPITRCHRIGSQEIHVKAPSMLTRTMKRGIIGDTKTEDQEAKRRDLIMVGSAVDANVVHDGPRTNRDCIMKDISKWVLDDTLRFQLIPYRRPISVD